MSKRDRLTPSILTQVPNDEYVKTFTTWSIESILVKQWVEKHLNVESSSSQVGRCIHAGRDTYSRKDGTTLTPDDVAAIHYGTYGQINNFYPSKDGLSMVHCWECDSSD